MKLSIKQTIALDLLEDSVTEEVLYGGAAGGGKSLLGSYWLIKSCLKYPGTRWVMGRASLKTLKETTLTTFFTVCALQGLKAGQHYTYYDNPKNLIVFANGSEILLKDLADYPTDPNFDELGSLEITGAFIDEVIQISPKAKNTLKSRIRFKLVQYGLIAKMLMSCNPGKKWVYYEFYLPFKMGMEILGKRFVQAFVTDNPDKEFVRIYRNNLMALDIQSRERLLYGNWEYDDDPAALIQYKSILDLFSNEFVPKGERYLSADIARFGSDQTVIGLWSGWRCEKIITLKGASVTEVAVKISELRIMHKVSLHNVVVDEDGVGGGVKDILGCMGFVNNSSPIDQEWNVKENYTNLKSQCYFRLASRINENEIFVMCEDPKVKDMIIQELEQVKIKDVDKDGKKAVMPKDKVKEIIGRSPDYSDMLMMRQYFELQPQWQVAVA